MSAMVQSLLIVGSGGGGPTPPPFSGNRGLIAGGYTGSTTRQYCRYVTIATTGNTSDFGSQPVALRDMASASNGTRAVFSGGYGTAAPGYESRVDYYTVATTGNSTFFGSLSGAKGRLGGCSDGTTAIFGGGTNGSDYQTAIEQVTISTTGNATGAGSLSAAKAYISACASTTRGVFTAGYQAPSYVNTAAMEYMSFASLSGTATSFGSLSTACRDNADASDGTTGLIALARTTVALATIDQITIATTGNSTAWGNLTVSRSGTSACANATRAIFSGGMDSSNVYMDTIDYNDFASAANSTDFGDLYWSGSSNAVNDTASASGA